MKFLLRIKPWWLAILSGGKAAFEWLRVFLSDGIWKVAFKWLRGIFGPLALLFGPLTIFVLTLLVWRISAGTEAIWIDHLLGTSGLGEAATTNRVAITNNASLGKSGLEEAATVKWETVKALAQTLFGFGLIIGIYVAYRRALALDKTAEAQHNANEQKMFNDATAKLGDKSAASVRLGGIYALDRLARLNETYLASIKEILGGHLRETTQQKDYQKEYKNKPSNEIQSLFKILNELNRLSKERKDDEQS